MPRRVVVDLKFVAFMFVSLAANYIKYTETGEYSEFLSQLMQSLRSMVDNSAHTRIIKTIQMGNENFRKKKIYFKTSNMVAYHCL